MIKLYSGGSEQGLLKINAIGISAPLAQKDNCKNKHLLVKVGYFSVCCRCYIFNRETCFEITTVLLLILLMNYYLVLYKKLVCPPEGHTVHQLKIDKITDWPTDE